jgi:hypothetical protein
MRDDLDDGLDNLFQPVAAKPAAAPAKPFVPFEERAAKIEHRALFEESCKGCGGSGEFRGYSGRYVGPCYKCKGKGKLSFKTDPATREAAREAAAAKKERAIAETHEAYKAAHPAAFEWMTTSAASFEFARNMLEALTKWGSLTEKQQAAVDKCVGARAAAQARREAGAVEVNGDKIAAAFARVVQSTNAATDNDAGTMWKLPRLRLDTFELSPARKDPSIIYVKEGETYLGKIVAGRFQPARECTDEHKARIATACSDPDAAARQYGLRFGVCSCCGRTLTNKESRELGIGPVCRSKWFAI